MVHGQRCSKHPELNQDPGLRSWTGEPDTPVICLVQWLTRGEFFDTKISRLYNPIGSKDTMWVPPGECHKVKNEKSEADYSMRSKCSISNSEYCLHCL